ncbi:MAG: hypothetical protein IAF38_22395 [Bacteroidia bacterium]|nr:hypothetical protein [Bacteroidia bacterium]
MKIDIPNACPEKWESMSATEEGAFCKVCNKGLVDLTKKTPEQIKTILEKKKDEDYVCAKLSTRQIFKMNFDDFFQRFRFWNLTRRIALVVFFTFGLGLFSCKTKQPHKVGKVKNTNPNTVQGKVAPTPNDTKVGLIEYNPNVDSTGNH